MPNWVMNRVHCANPQALADLRDFNRIVPMPLALEKTEAGARSAHVASLLHQGLSFREMLERPPCFGKRVTDDFGTEIALPSEDDKALWPQLLRRYYLCKRLYGLFDWYEWSNHRWGCKWNAQDFCWIAGDLTCCIFLTPWCNPIPLLVALSEKYPDEPLTVYFADEDIGYNAGRYIVQNGQYLEEDRIVEGRREAYGIAFDLWGLDPQQYRYVASSDSYEYLDNEEDNGTIGMEADSEASPSP